MITFVLVTLTDPTAPEGTVALLRVPALVQKIHEDKTADLTVFANAEILGALGALGPCFFLPRVPLDAERLKAPSYASDEDVKAAEDAKAALVEEVAVAAPVALAKVASVVAAPVVSTGVPGTKPGPVIPHTPPEQRMRVFGKGANKHTSSRSGSVRRFESASIAGGKGNMSAEQVARIAGEPNAHMPMSGPRRVFVKGKGEVTSRRQQAMQGGVAGPVDAEKDPMGAIDAFLSSPDDETNVPASPDEIPAPAPVEALAAGPAPHANGSVRVASDKRSTSGQPL